MSETYWRVWNDAYKASYGRGGIFNQATVAFYWSRYEPESGQWLAGLFLPGGSELGVK